LFLLLGVSTFILNQVPFLSVILKTTFLIFFLLRRSKAGPNGKPSHPITRKAFIQISSGTKIRALYSVFREAPARRETRSSTSTRVM